MAKHYIYIGSKVLEMAQEKTQAMVQEDEEFKALFDMFDDDVKAEAATAVCVS